MPPSLSSCALAVGSLCPPLLAFFFLLLLLILPPCLVQLASRPWHSGVGRPLRQMTTTSGSFTRRSSKSHGMRGR